MNINDTTEREAETMDPAVTLIDTELAASHFEEPVDFEPAPEDDDAEWQAWSKQFSARLDAAEAEARSQFEAARPTAGLSIEHRILLTKSAISGNLASEVCATWYSVVDLPDTLNAETRAAWTRLLKHGPLLAFRLTALDGWAAGKPIWRTVWQVRDPRPDSERPKGAPKYLQESGSGTATNVVSEMRARLEAGTYTHLVPIEGTKQALAVASAILGASAVWDRCQLDGLPLPDGYDKGGIDPRKVVVIGLSGCTGWCQGSRAASDEGEMGVVAEAADRETWVLQPAIARATKGKKVVIGFDQDTATNPNVHTSAAKLRARLHQAGVRRGSVSFLQLAGDDTGEKDGADDILGRIADPDERAQLILDAISSAGPLGPAPEIEQTTVDEKVVTDFEAGETYTMEVFATKAGKTITKKGHILANAGFEVLGVEVTTDARGLGGGETRIVITLRTSRMVNGQRFVGQPFRVDASKLESRSWYVNATPGSEKGGMIQVASRREVDVANAIKAEADRVSATIDTVRTDISGGWLAHPETGERCYVTANGALCADRFDPSFCTSHQDMLGVDPFSIPEGEWVQSIEALLDTYLDLTAEGRTEFMADLAHRASAMMQAGRPAGLHVVRGGSGSGKSTLAIGASRIVGVRSITKFDDSKGAIDEFAAGAYDGCALIDDGRASKEIEDSQATRRPGDDPDELFRKLLQPILRIGMEGGERRRSRLVRDDASARGYTKTATDMAWPSVAAVVEKMPGGLLNSDVMRAMEFTLGVHGRTWRDDRPGAVGRFEMNTRPGGVLAKVWAMIMVSALRRHGRRGEKSLPWLAAATVSLCSDRLLVGWDPEAFIPDDDMDDAEAWIYIRRSWQEHIVANEHWQPREAEVASTYLAGLGVIGAALDSLIDDVPVEGRGRLNDIRATLMCETSKIEQSMCACIDEHTLARQKRQKPGVRYLTAIKTPIATGRAWLHDASANHDDNPGFGDLVGNQESDGVMIMSAWASKQCDGADTRKIVAALKEIGVDAKAGGKQRIGRGKSEVELRAIWIPNEGGWRSTPGEDDNFDLAPDTF